jgi:hypothetical protein
MTEPITLNLTLKELQQIDKYVEVNDDTLSVLMKIKDAYPSQKSSVEEAYKKAYGYYPDMKHNMNSFSIFQKGYEAHQSLVEDANKIIGDTESYCLDDPSEYDEIEWDEKDNPPEPTRNKYFERILNAPIDERGYIDLREPASEFRQKLFDGIKSVFYDPEYERTHWSVKVNMAVDEVLTHFQDVIPESQEPVYDDFDKGWNCCLAKIKTCMEHIND